MTLKEKNQEVTKFLKENNSKKYIYLIDDIKQFLVFNYEDIEENVSIYDLINFIEEEIYAEDILNIILDKIEQYKECMTEYIDTIADFVKVCDNFYFDYNNKTLSSLLNIIALAQKGEEHYQVEIAKENDDLDASEEHF